MATVTPSSPPSTDFFKAGGTLHIATPSYVPRPADEELFKRLLAGQFCYVLTSRQMGKSSLMIRTADRLHAMDIRTAIIDLSGLGTQVTPSQWYLGIVTRLANQLKLSVNVEVWWQMRTALSVVQRFTDFVQEVILEHIADRIVIFCDEIDSTLKLDFTDDFFAAIRTFYNARASHADYARITFVLLGVATPTDLIKDRNRTPFNIGHAIDLGELSRADALPLAQGLDAAYPGQGATLLDRVFTWTNGHPYLTQKVCQALVEQVDYFLKSGHEVQHSDQKANSFYACVDRTVHHLFLDIDAQNEDNLRFVHSNIQASDERRRLLQIYRRVYTGTHVSEDERSPLHNRLKLIGLVRSQAGALQVRNEIYRCVFNHAWIKQNMPIDWTRIITIGSLIVVLLTIAWYLFIQRQQTVQRFAQLTITFENRDSIVNLRMLSLAVMCDTQRVQARVVFYRQPPEDQLTLLREVNPTVVKEKLTTITHCLMPPPDTLDENHRHEIEDALHEAQERGMNQR